jgi:hypothetical protein
MAQHEAHAASISDSTEVRTLDKLNTEPDEEMAIPDPVELGGEPDNHKSALDPSGIFADPDSIFTPDDPLATEPSAIELPCLTDC